MSELLNPSPAEIMDPGNPENPRDESGHGVTWNPTAVLEAVESPAAPPPDQDKGAQDETE